MKNDQNSTLEDMKWPQEWAATIPYPSGVFDAAFSKCFQNFGLSNAKTLSLICICQGCAKQHIALVVTKIRIFSYTVVAMII